MNRELIPLTLLTAAESAHAFSAWMPSWFTIKTFALEGDPAAVSQKLSNLRSGYLPSMTFSLGLGALVSILARHPLPLLASAVTAGFMIWQYERALPERMRLSLNGQTTLAAFQPCTGCGGMGL